MLTSILPDEIWQIIIGEISPRSAEVSTYELSILSEESFASGLLPLEPTENPPGLRDLHNMRCSCVHFSKLCERYVFMRIVTRFKCPDLSRNSEQEDPFQRLTKIAMGDKAIHVKQFSYMVPRLFGYPAGLVESDFDAIRATVRREIAAFQVQIDKLQGSSHSSSSNNVDRQRSPLTQLQKKLKSTEAKAENIEEIVKRALHQRKVLTGKLDEAALLTAFKSFSGLRLIRFMPLNDKADISFERYLDSHPDLAVRLRPSLTDAFHHGAQTLAVAVKKSDTNASRFSSRSLDLRTLILTDSIRETMRDVAKRLTALDLHVVYQQNDNTESQMHTLSALFKVMFEAAFKLQAVHVGFGRRVSIPLQFIFHDVQFHHLQHIGLHEWRLHAAELVSLLDHHKKSLRSLRLRRVSLKEEATRELGLWSTVLEYIRLNLKLDWISLRGVAYNDDTLTMGRIQFGQTIYGPPPPGSDTDDSEPFDDDDLSEDGWSVSNNSETQDSSDEVGEHASDQGNGPFQTHNNEGDNQSETNESETTTVGQPQDDLEDSTDESIDDHDDMSDLDDIHNLTVAEIPETEANHPIFVSSNLRCYCDKGYAFGQLRDNGLYVTKARWKKWEQWTLKRCERGHDPSPQPAT